MTVTLYHGDCFDILPTLEAGSVDVVVTDPPYNGVKSEDWDNQWKNDAEYLDWLNTIIIEFSRVLKFNGSLYLFASPQMSARVELLIGGQLNVLNSIRWIKGMGWHKKADKEQARSYFSPWESIIFAEKYGSIYDDVSIELHKKVYTPIGIYIRHEKGTLWINKESSRSCAWIYFEQ